MLEKKINPYASEIWNYGKKEVGANLLTVSKEELIMCLMPRTTGRFSRFGLRVNKLRYRHDNYTEKYLTGGEVTALHFLNCLVFDIKSHYNCIKINFGRRL